MIGIIAAFITALLLSFLLTPWLIRFLVKRHYGQFIRQDGPTTHITKRGTPTMGGILIIGSTIVGWLVGCFINSSTIEYSSSLLVGLLITTGIIGFLDDFLKVIKHRSLGLRPLGKSLGLLLVGSVFIALSLLGQNSYGFTSFDGKIGISYFFSINLQSLPYFLMVIIALLWGNFLISSWSNAVNLTDGLDGLATLCSLCAFSAYTIVCYWQANHLCAFTDSEACYAVRDPLGMAVFCSSIVGALLGFLWWNTTPARIFMGDTGSLALGSAFAGVSFLTGTEIIGAVIGGLFFTIVMSDVIQIAVFRKTGKRVFKMAPLHHHFELAGWQEVTIVVRFFILASLFALGGVGLFYLDWLIKL